MSMSLDRRAFLKQGGAAAALLAVGGSRGIAQVPDRSAPQHAESGKRLLDDPIFAAVLQFGELMCAHGTDVYGRPSPLMVGQLNVLTRRIPAGTSTDPGLFTDNPELGGCQPFCENLLFDFGLLDTLHALSEITGRAEFDRAGRAYLSYYLSHGRHPKSGYFPWGEHVGYDVVRDTIHQGAYKGEHEVKGVFIPWNQLWEIDPDATRHEIEVALYRHICDPATFAFNRHADMAGATPSFNSACSLANSGGLYLHAWTWLYHQTGEQKFLDWAQHMARHYWSKRSPSTGLFCTSEDRPREMWYADVLPLAVFLLRAAAILGIQKGAVFRQQALAYFHAYARYAVDPEGHGFFSTLDSATGKPTTADHPKYLPAWPVHLNDTSVIGLATKAGAGYEASGDPTILGLYDRALRLIAVEERVARQTPMQAGDAAGVLFSLLDVARRSGNAKYLKLAGELADYVLEKNRNHGLFVSAGPEVSRYYSARLGSADLAAALLAYALTKHGRPELAPPLRNLFGTMPS